MTKSKPWWQSKTFWVAIFMLLSYFVGRLSGWDAVDEVLIPLWGVLALVLRAVTDEKISIGKAPDLKAIRPKGK